jgi:hypothetical protein
LKYGSGPIKLLACIQQGGGEGLIEHKLE